MLDSADTTGLRSLLARGAASFAVGVPGVLAEFHRADADRMALDEAGIGAVSTLGALRITARGDERAYALARDSDHHGHGEGDAGHDAPGDAWCYWLPESEARLPPARGLSELGPDGDAIRDEDRDAVLFDMGLDLGHVRACVRSADPALVRVLRDHLGSNLLERGNPAMAAIKAAGPHRVFHSRMARIEVYQPIPSRSRGERTPEGPHTHVLPALIGADDPQLAALPGGARVVLTVYPAS